MSYVVVIGAVRCMTALGSNLPKLVLGQVGEVSGVGRGHFFEDIVELLLKFESELTGGNGVRSERDG